jgi:hypothetical protein
MTTPDLAQDRARVAHHEAAHVAAGYALGLEITGPAVILPAEETAGHCHVGKTIQLPSNGQRPPTPMLYRAEVTARVLMLLAGQHGTWQTPELPTASHPAGTVARFADLLTEGARRVAERPDQPRTPGDYHRALSLLATYYSEQPGLAGAYLELLDQEAGHLVTKLRRPIGLLARELLDHDQVDAARLAELCEQNVAKPLLPWWDYTAILTMTDA